MNVRNVEREAKMKELRAQGYTQGEIAKEFGISKQRVSQIMATRTICHFRGWKPEECVYPGLRDWMNENKVNMSELVRIIHGHNSCTNMRIPIKKWLSGQTEPKLSTISKLIDVSGLTYEQLFREGVA